MTSKGLSEILQPAKQLRAVQKQHVVVGHPMDHQQLSGKVLGIRQHRARFVARRVIRRALEIALGVVRVVEGPIGDGRARDARHETHPAP